MKEYFKLQFVMTNRKLFDFGIHPIIGYLLLLLAFVGLSVFLFYKTTFASHAYILIALAFTSKLSEVKRNDFLKIVFGNKQCRKIRILENLIIVFPFTTFLLYKEQFYFAIFLNAMAIFVALLNFKTTYNITIPTPFYKKPFEFTVGFRNTFFLFFIAYGLMVIAVKVNNFNLGIFSLMLIFLTVLCYYLKPENEYFVWSYSLTPVKFLIEKIRTAFLFSFYLCVPILFMLSIFYPENMITLLFFIFLGYLYLTTVIFAKYAAYPNEIDVVQVVIMSICIVFPPLLIAVIPFFANQSVNKLKEFLT